MGLPQELVDHITNMLYDDLPSLQACSLTCKAMFASTRHLIHQTLCLTPRNNGGILTGQEKSSFRRPHSHGAEIRFLSYMSEHNFLQYTRQVHIRGFPVFNPDILLPHLCRLKSLDRVHTLTIEHYYTPSWQHLPRICFDHFHPTLTSLTLTRPFGHYRALLRFALQFPRLENLGFEWLKHDKWTPRDLIAPPTVDQFPPLHGHLRLAFERNAIWPRELIRGIQHGIGFRSLELESEYFWDQGLHFMNAYSQSLEDLTIETHGSGTRSRWGGTGLLTYS